MQPSTGADTARFPTTIHTWIDERLEQGPEGLREIRDHVMAVYRDPLVRYATRSRSLNWQEPEDLVHEFVSDGMQAPDYFVRWRGSGLKPLRVWLVNGLHFQQHKLRRRPADRLPLDFSWDPDDCWSRVEEDPLEELCRAWRDQVVELAMALAERSCGELGQSLGWESFRAHRLDGESYGSIGLRLGQPRSRVEVLARAGWRAFQRELFGLLEREGIPRSRAARELLGAEAPV